MLFLTGSSILRCVETVVLCRLFELFLPPTPVINKSIPTQQHWLLSLKSMLGSNDGKKNKVTHIRLDLMLRHQEQDITSPISVLGELQCERHRIAFG